MNCQRTSDCYGSDPSLDTAAIYCCRMNTTANTSICCTDSTMELNTANNDSRSNTTGGDPSTYYAYTLMFGDWWEVLIVIGFMVLVALFVGCKVCGRSPCGKKRTNHASRHRRSRVGTASESTASNENADSSLPAHVVVLSPPDYDTVCMDLPKYEDVEAENAAAAAAVHGAANTAELQGVPNGATRGGGNQAVELQGVANAGFDGDGETRGPDSNGAIGAGVMGADSNGAIGAGVMDAGAPRYAWGDESQRVHPDTPPPPYPTSS